MPERLVGVIGASGLVGECLLEALMGEGWNVAALSRNPDRTLGTPATWPTTWHNAAEEQLPQRELWISTAPIWLLPEYFERLVACGARRVVALSSTSRFSKAVSNDPVEQTLARQWQEGETALQSWATTHGIEWVILRPTLIYGRTDGNINAMIRFIRRFGFLPVLGKASGKRQPVRAADVARVCIAALTAPAARNQAYNIGGGETLTYREMAQRVFVAQDCRPRFLTIPVPLFNLAKPLSRLLPRRLRWLVAMMERMNKDLAFDDSQARRDLEYMPANFAPPMAKDVSK